MTNYNYTCISEVNGKHHSTTEETVNEYKVLKAYFELKEGIIGNTSTTKRIDTLNYFSDGTITDFCYTTITRFKSVRSTLLLSSVIVVLLKVIL